MALKQPHFYVQAAFLNSLFRSHSITFRYRSIPDSFKTATASCFYSTLHSMYTRLNLCFIPAISSQLYLQEVVAHSTFSFKKIIKSHF